MNQFERFLLLGDTHGDISNVVNAISYAQRNAVKTIYQLGDFGCYPEIPNFLEFMQIVSRESSDSGIVFKFLPGNHEDWNFLSQFNKPTEILPNLVFLPTGTRFNIGEYKILIVGGGYSRDKSHRTEGYNYFKEEILSLEDYVKCVEGGEVDVIFSHDRPISVSEKIGPALYDSDAIENGNVLESICNLVKPKFFYHGHYHLHYYTEIRDCQYYGLAGNKGHQTQMMILDV